MALAFGLQLAIAGPAPPPRGPATLELLVAAISVGTLYAINAWSFPVVAGLVALGALVRLSTAGTLRERTRTLAWTAVMLLLAVLAVLPFLLTYDNAANGFGDRLRPRVVQRLGAPPRRALRAARLPGRHRISRAARGLAPPVADGGLGARRGGVRRLAAGDRGPRRRRALLALVWVAAHAAFFSRAAAVERYAWVLIAGGFLCLLIPELIYVKDSFDGGELYRMNTVFKLGYQAWLLLAIAGAAGIVWSWGWMGRRRRLVQLAWGVPLVALLALAAVYPVAGTYARKDGFSRLADAERAALARGVLARRPAGDGVAARQRAARRRRARGGGRRLLGLRPCPDLDVHRAADGDGLAGPRAPVGARPGPPPPGRRAAVPHDRRGGRAPAARPLRRPLRRRRPARAHDYGDAGVAKWDELGRRVFDRDGTTVWELR